MAALEDGILKTLRRVLTDIPNVFEGSLEVEAKFGILIDRQTNTRVCLPIITECIIDDGYHVRFESDIGLDIHRHLNKLLNKATEAGLYRYVHTKTLDRFVQGPTGQKIRITCDSSGSEILEVIEKKRLKDVSIHFPNAPFDVRISINQELVVKHAQHPNANSSTDSRYKDRLKYTSKSGFYCLDLTQVTNDKGQKIHEIEVEVLSQTPDSIAAFLGAIRGLAWDICQAVSGK